MKKILALFFAISTILFSCDNEIQNTPEIDHCKICDGIQDEYHQHDYCGDCDGVQTDPSHTCPVIEDPNQYTKKLGDGTYEIHNFMTDTTADNITDQVNEWLPKAETKIRGMLNELSPEFRSKYSEQVGIIEASDTFEIDLTSGIDPVINRINRACTPIFEEIIANIDTPLDRAKFLNYYDALSNEAYKYGYSYYFDDNPNNQEAQEKKYAETKNNLSMSWAMMHAMNQIQQPFNIIEDIENNNCQNITESMKQLLINNNVATDMRITQKDLDRLFNLSFSGVYSLSAMHDYANDENLSTHQSCVITENKLLEVMTQKADSIAIAPAKLNKSIFSQKLGRELC